MLEPTIIELIHDVVSVIHELLDTSEGAGKRLVPDRPAPDTVDDRLHPLHLRLEFPDGTGEADSMKLSVELAGG